MRSTIEGGKGNCQKLDPTSILHIIDDTCNVNKEDVSITNAALIRKYDLAERTSIPDHDYAIPNTFNLSEFKKASISYIAGYVAKMAEKKMLCMPCSKALGSVNHQPESTFLKLKDRGSLFKPSQSVITICEETKMFRTNYESFWWKPPSLQRYIRSHSYSCVIWNQQVEGFYRA